MNPKPALLETFERVVVISLARRSERLARFNRLVEEGWPFRRPQLFAAIDGQRVEVPACWGKGAGAWGCMLSHRAVLASALRDGVGSLFVLEDDAVPGPHFAARAAEFLAAVPTDWDCLMFGGEHLSAPVAVSPGVVRCTLANRAHAYALRGKMMVGLLTCWHHFENDHCDVILASLMPHFNVYAPEPFLIGQAEGESDITGKAEPLRFLPAAQVQAVEKAEPGCAVGSTGGRG